MVQHPLCDSIVYSTASQRLAQQHKNYRISGRCVSVAFLDECHCVGNSQSLHRKRGICYYFVADSNKVLALITGVSTFLFFKNLKIGYSKAINTIAASTFGVLLIHANSDTMRRWLWGDVCNNVGAYQEGNIIIHAIASVMVIYFVCTIIDMIRNRLIEQPLIKRS